MARVPIIHPERISWIKDHAEEFVRTVKAGVWMQLTAERGPTFRTPAEILGREGAG